MVVLYSAVVSSAALEHIFTSFGLVLTKLRNKLGLQKAAKLVFIYRILGGPKELAY